MHIHTGVRIGGGKGRVIVDVFRTDAHVYFLADVIAGHALNLTRRHANGVGAEHGKHAVAALFQLYLEYVHLRRADEAAYEQVCRIVVQILRGILLLHHAVLHHHDARAHRHSLGLIVGDVDEGGLQLLVQLRDFGARLYAQLRVQVGQRFIHQEYLRFADDGAPERHALALTAGKRRRLAVQQGLNAQTLRGRLYAPVDLVLGHLVQLQTEGHVVVDRHVRIERVALEHHGNVPVLRGHVVDQLIVDIQFAAGDLLKTGHHAQRCRFATARRADQHDKLLVLDLEVQVIYGHDIAGIDLVDIPQ